MAMHARSTIRGEKSYLQRSGLLHQDTISPSPSSFYPLRHAVSNGVNPPYLGRAAFASAPKFCFRRKKGRLCSEQQEFLQFTEVTNRCIRLMITIGWLELLIGGVL